MPNLPGLRAARELRYLTQGELAERSGVSRITISRLEVGSQSAHPSTARRLARALACNVSGLTGDAPLVLRRLPEQEQRRVA